MKGKYFLIVILVLIMAIGTGIYLKFNRQNPNEKLYVALEGEGKVVVVNIAKQTIFNTIDLAVDHDGERFQYVPHDVQVSPDGKSVWVTANVGGSAKSSASIIPHVYAHGGENPESDSVIIIDPQNDSIVTRIAIAPNIRLTHIAFTPDGAFAYITALRAGVIYKMNTATFEIDKKVMVSEGQPPDMRTMPDGMTPSNDGARNYIANRSSGDVSVVDTATGQELAKIPVGSQPHGISIWTKNLIHSTL